MERGGHRRIAFRYGCEKQAQWEFITSGEDFFGSGVEENVHRRQRVGPDWSRASISGE